MRNWHKCSCSIFICYFQIWSFTLPMRNWHIPRDIFIVTFVLSFTLPMRNWHSFPASMSFWMIPRTDKLFYLTYEELTRALVNTLFALSNSFYLTYEELTRLRLLPAGLTPMSGFTLPMRNWHTGGGYFSFSFLFRQVLPYLWGIDTRILEDPVSCCIIIRFTLPMRNWHFTQAACCGYSLLCLRARPVLPCLWGIDTLSCRFGTST